VFTAALQRYAGHRVDHSTGEVLEEVLPMVRAIDGVDLKFVVADQDGSALWVFDRGGLEESFEVTGVYGDVLGQVQAPLFKTGVDWVLDSLHEGERDLERGVVHRGQRHALLADGRWMQPEPRFAIGLTKPGARGLTGVYAAANPVIWQDITGFDTLVMVMVRDYSGPVNHIDVAVGKEIRGFFTNESGSGALTSSGHTADGAWMQEHRPQNVDSSHENPTKTTAVLLTVSDEAAATIVSTIDSSGAYSVGANNCADACGEALVAGGVLPSVAEQIVTKPFAVLNSVTAANPEAPVATGIINVTPDGVDLEDAETGDVLLSTNGQTGTSSNQEQTSDKD
jgi:hypothetical protein